MERGDRRQKRGSAGLAHISAAALEGRVVLEQGKYTCVGCEQKLDCARLYSSLFCLHEAYNLGQL